MFFLSIETVLLLVFKEAMAVFSENKTLTFETLIYCRC
jgi:hypothetical protein